MTLESIVEFLGKLGGLPGFALVFLFCIGAIKALRSAPRFPNDAIWMAAMLMGMVLNGLIADPYADGFSLRVWLMKNALFGGVIGFIAVIAYNKVLKRYIKFFDGQREGDTDIMGRPPEEPPVRSHHKK